MIKNDLLVRGLGDMGLIPTQDQTRKFQLFYELLIDRNQSMNLTNITDYDEVMVKHFLDSINVIKAYGLMNTNSILDVGTGAGFPGIPLKIMFPHLSVTLMDALNKRVQFMNEVIDQLDLIKINAIHSRAEILAQDHIFRTAYDLVVSRAVSQLSTLSEYCLPFVKIGGHFIAYKSTDTEEEISEAKNAISLLGGKIQSVSDFKVPESDILRRYVVIKKISDTPPKYPRKAGTPSKKPL
ncbi:MAG: 16S rRNA (guanine(527)-N(7))-methyltransferase RsmG [Vallitaleaceae bacterium]|nr:16S rRNA (guanine(527)-N(7))-methyltransferase RsmG [Vallitaleaceae bacterium]